MMDMIDLLFVLFNTSCIDITNNDPYGTVNSPFCEPCTFVSMKESRENCELFFFFGEVWRFLRGRENGLCSNPQKIQSERVEVVVGGGSARGEGWRVMYGSVRVRVYSLVSEGAFQSR